MRIYTDEIINAICYHFASRKQIKPTEVEAQLSWDEDLGYTGEVWIQGRSQYIVESNILEAIEQYMYNHHEKRVFRSQISLDIEEDDFVAIIAD